MGKEAKIGLSVVGVLLVIFTGLLVWRFVPHGSNPMAVTSDSGATDPSDGADRPTVVTVQQDVNAASAANPAVQTASEPDAAAEMPRRGFMPSPAPAADTVPDRYATDRTSEESPPDRPSSADPFKRPQARDNQSEVAGAPRELQVDPQEAAAIENSAPPARSARNPLRRLSAEVPLDTVPTADQALSTEAADLDLNGANAPSPAEQDNADAALPPIRDPRDESSDNFDERPPARVPVDMSTRPRSRYSDVDQAVETPAPVEPQMPADGKYTIQPNDSLWSISEKVYGNGRYFKAIYEHNRGKLPSSDRLTVGTVIAVPPASLLEENYPALCPKQRKSVMVQPRHLQTSAPRSRASSGDVYVVEEGDTLFDIARYELGKASRWAEIYELNREALGEDFDYLQPGTQLRLPQREARGDAVTRQRDAIYR
jgi:nucleoid-associated protein YgaU